MLFKQYFKKNNPSFSMLCLLCSLSPVYGDDQASVHTKNKTVTEPLLGHFAFRVSGGFTTVSQHTAGLSDNDAGFSYSSDINLTGDYAKIGTLTFVIETAQGHSVRTGALKASNGDDKIGVFNLEGNGGYSQTRLYEARFDVQVAEKLRLTLGKMDPVAQFDDNAVAKREYDHFLDTAFVDNPAIGFPTATTGVVVGVPLGWSIQTKWGIFEATSDVPGLLADNFTIGELSVAAQFAGKAGNYRLQIWHNDHLGKFNSNDYGDDKGIAFNMDQKITHNMTLFAKFGTRDERIAGFDQAMAVGGNLDMAQKRFVLALAYAQFNTPLTAKKNEAHAALNFKWMLAPHLSLAAEVQYITHPGLDATVGDVTVYGVRSHIYF